MLLVTALDQFNNRATNYTGTLTFNSSDGQALVPAATTLTAGVGAFVADLKTAGNQTYAVTDSATVITTSTTVAVGAGALGSVAVVAPATAVVGVPISFTVSAKDAFGNSLPTYAGTVHFTSSDSAATLPADTTLSGGSGVFNATLATTGDQVLTATDSAGGLSGTSVAIAVRGLIVTGLTSTPTGFAVTFDKPFNPTTLSLYSAPADVLLVNGAGHAVRGSLVLNTAPAAPVNTSFSFIATGSGTSGLLTAGTYTVTLVSGPNGIKDSSGVQLDGTNSGSRQQLCREFYRGLDSHGDP